MGSRKTYVEVALPVPLRKTFSYVLPDEFSDKVRLGSRLIVPFGKRSLIGYVVASYEDVEEIGGLADLKQASQLLDEEPLLTPEILELTRWAADYYMASWGEFLKVSLPAGVNSKVERVINVVRDDIEEFANNRSSVRSKILKFLSKKQRTTVSELYRVFGKRSIQRIISDLEKRGFISISNQILQARAKPKMQKFVVLLEEDGNLTKAQQRVVSVLKQEEKMPYRELIDKTNVSSSVLKSLQKKGVIEISEQEVYRNPFEGLSLREAENISLNEAQRRAINEIQNYLIKGEYRTFLLHGVTGSGKTTVYVHAIEEALKLGRSSLVLVPEIALTPFFSARLLSVFGDQVAMLHSSLSESERFDQWRRVREGKAKIVIGTRSAIFAPLENIGLIVVDEEHDSSYRQQEVPPYSARDLAVVRAKLSNAVTILGSATPSLESFYNAKLGKYHYLSLPERAGSRSLAKVEVVDMRKVFQQEGESLASSYLISAIEKTINNNSQVIILLNRRGFSQFALCSKCGEAIRCKDCDITLTYHKGKRILLCHYCNYQIAVPSKCPSCYRESLFFVGGGTEKVEEILRNKFPMAKIARLDRDTVQKREFLEKRLQEFAEGKIDILVGTQMVSKGHDFPGVTLVGVISVDNILSLPDFRAGEKAFQLLTQVAGRSGRGKDEGKVIVQTFYPEHYVVRFASEQNYEKFYQKEISFRQKLQYPPFSSLACVLVQHRNYNHAVQTALSFKSCLDKANSLKELKIMDVSPAPISKLKGKHRLQILIKSLSRKRLHQVLEMALALAEKKKCDLQSIQIEVDPASLI